MGAQYIGKSHENPCHSTGFAGRNMSASRNGNQKAEDEGQLSKPKDGRQESRHRQCTRRATRETESHVSTGTVGSVELIPRGAPHPFVVTSPGVHQDVGVTVDPEASRLARRLGLGGATAVGIGAMLGTGVFAAWTPAVHAAGSLVLVALVVAALVAVLNAWSSVRLAAAHPVSGGSYAYGRRWRGRAAGVTAGYSFVLGKSASAGAAALTIGAYVDPVHQRLIATVAVALVLVINLRGVVTSAAVTAVLSAFVIVVLLLLIVATARDALSKPVVTVLPTATARGLVEAAAVLFVAFAGYARVTVLGEEVRNPQRIIPRAVAFSLSATLVLYLGIGLVVVVAVSHGVELTTAPLAAIARSLGERGLSVLIPVAAVVAAGAALLSLIAGVGRTWFAMARHGDAPSLLAAVSRRRAWSRAWRCGGS